MGTWWTHPSLNNRRLRPARIHRLERDSWDVWKPPPAILGSLGGDRPALAKAKRLVVLVGNGVLRHPGRARRPRISSTLILLANWTNPAAGLDRWRRKQRSGTVEMGAVAEFLPGPMPLNDQAGAGPLDLGLAGRIADEPGASRSSRCWPPPTSGHSKPCLSWVRTQSARYPPPRRRKRLWQTGPAGLSELFSRRRQRWPTWCSPPARTWKKTAPLPTRRPCPGRSTGDQSDRDSRPDWGNVVRDVCVDGGSTRIWRRAGDPQRNPKRDPRVWPARDQPRRLPRSTKQY